MTRNTIVKNPTTVKRKIIYGILIIIILVALGAIISGKPELLFFGFFYLFLFVFMGVAMTMLQSRLKFLKSSNSFAQRILKASGKSQDTIFNNNSLTNPMYFHILMVILILLNLILSYFDVKTYDDTFYEQFYNDLAFQFNIAILFTILGFLNPLLSTSDFLSFISKGNSETLNTSFVKNKKLFYYRLLACVIVIVFFIYKGWLVFPNFLGDNLILKGIDLALLFFIATTVFRMINHSKTFLVENIFRVIKSFTIFTTAIFIIVPLAPLTMLTISLMGIDENSFNFQPIPFIGFNLIMVYVEYTLNSTESEPTELVTSNGTKAAK